MAEERNPRGRAAASKRDYHKAIPYLPERRPHRTALKASHQPNRLQGSKETVVKNLRDSLEDARSDVSQTKKKIGLTFKIDLPKLSTSS